MSKGLGFLFIPADLLLLFLTYRLAFVLRATAISVGFLTRSVADPYPTASHHFLFLIITQLLALWVAGLYHTPNWRFGRSFFRAGAAFFGQVLALFIYTFSQKEVLWLTPLALFWGLNTTAVALLRGVAGTFLPRLGPEAQGAQDLPPGKGTVELLDAVSATLNVFRELEQECDGWAAALDGAMKAGPTWRSRTIAICEEGYNRSRRALALRRLELAQDRWGLECVHLRLVGDLRKTEEALDFDRFKQSLRIVPSLSDGTSLQQEKDLEEIREQVQHVQELMTLCLEAVGIDHCASWPARLRLEVRMRFEAVLFRWMHLPLIKTYRVVDFLLEDIARVFIAGFMVLLIVCASLLAAVPFATGVVRWWAASDLWVTDPGPIGDVTLPSGETLAKRLASLKDESFRNSPIGESVIRFPIQWLAEQIAIIAYLLLVIGVGIRLYQLFRERNVLPDEPGG